MICIFERTTKKWLHRELGLQSRNAEVWNCWIGDRGRGRGRGRGYSLNAYIHSIPLWSLKFGLAHNFMKPRHPITGIDTSYDLSINKCEGLNASSVRCGAVRRPLESIDFVASSANGQTRSIWLFTPKIGGVSSDEKSAHSNYHLRSISVWKATCQIEMRVVGRRSLGRWNSILVHDFLDPSYGWIMITMVFEVLKRRFDLSSHLSVCIQHQSSVKTTAHSCILLLKLLSIELRCYRVSIELVNMYPFRIRCIP